MEVLDINFIFINKFFFSSAPNWNILNMINQMEIINGKLQNMNTKINNVQLKTFKLLFNKIVSMYVILTCYQKTKINK